MKKILITCGIAGLLMGGMHAQQNYVYTRPGLFTFITKIPGDMQEYSGQTFKKENIWGFQDRSSQSRFFLIKTSFGALFRIEEETSDSN